MGEKIFMYCSNCGNRIEENEKFCGKCGNKQSDDISKETINNKVLKPNAFVSWIIWSFVFAIISRIIIKAISNNFMLMYSLSVTELIILININWIFWHCVSIVLIYFNNKGTKFNLSFMMVLCYIYIIISEFYGISSFMNANFIVEVLCLVFHIFIVYFLNNKLYKKWCENE